MESASGLVVVLPWKFFANSRAKSSRLLSERVCEVCEDEQQDRLGLPVERTYLSDASHGRRSLTAFARRLNFCLVCRELGSSSDRWHMKFRCPGRNGELADKRRRIALWLSSHSFSLNASQVTNVLRACEQPRSSLDEAAARCALDAACGLPWTPDEDTFAKSRAHAVDFAKHVTGPWTEISELFV